MTFPSEQQIKKNTVTMSLLIMAILFFVTITLFILSKIYDGHLPKIVEEINNGAIGAILTAIITVLILGAQASANERSQAKQLEEQAKFQKELLEAQSKAEERKEYNVKVFEEKTKRYNNFINLLWKIWADRKVSLEELSQLFESVSKDILMYTGQKTTKAILLKMDRMADFAKFENISKEDQKEMQSCVFEIVNLLAMEINLGGKIEQEERDTLNSIENKILPYLNMKEYKNRFIMDFNNALKESGQINGYAEYKLHNDGGEYIFIKIDNSSVSLIIGPISKYKPCRTIIAFYVEFWEFRNYYKYRDAGRGWRKDFLKGVKWDPIEIVDFNNIESVNKLIDAYSKSSENTRPATLLANAALSYYNEWTCDSLSIDEIINKCEKT